MNPHWKGEPRKRRGTIREDPPIGKSTWHENAIWFGGTYRAGAVPLVASKRGPRPLPKEDR